MADTAVIKVVAVTEVAREADITDDKSHCHTTIDDDIDKGERTGRF